MAMTHINIYDNVLFYDGLHSKPYLQHLDVLSILLNKIMTHTNSQLFFLINFNQLQ